MSDPTRRRFDDEEVALILRRAGELQAESSAESGAPSGMTLADLEDVAREAGLDPALVRRAAAEVRGGTTRGVEPLQAGGNAFLGAPTQLRFERVVDGELSSDDYEAVVEEVRRTFADVGNVSVLGRTLAWRSSPFVRGRSGPSREVSVTFVSRDGQTSIRVDERTTTLAGGLFGGLVGGLGGGGGAIAMSLGMAVAHSPSLALGLWGLALASGYALARGIYAGAVNRRAGDLATLTDRLAAMVASATQNGRSSSS